MYVPVLGINTAAAGMYHRPFDDAGSYIYPRRSGQPHSISHPGVAVPRTAYPRDSSSPVRASGISCKDTHNPRSALRNRPKYCEDSIHRIFDSLGLVRTYRVSTRSSLTSEIADITSLGDDPVKSLEALWLPHHILDLLAGLLRSQSQHIKPQASPQISVPFPRNTE